MRSFRFQFITSLAVQLLKSYPFLNSPDNSNAFAVNSKVSAQHSSLFSQFDKRLLWHTSPWRLSFHSKLTPLILIFIHSFQRLFALLQLLKLPDLQYVYYRCTIREFLIIFHFTSFGSLTAMFFKLTTSCHRLIYVRNVPIFIHVRSWIPYRVLHIITSFMDPCFFAFFNVPKLNLEICQTSCSKYLQSRIDL